MTLKGESRICVHHIYSQRTARQGFDAEARKNTKHRSATVLHALSLKMQRNYHLFVWYFPTGIAIQRDM